MAGWYVGLFGGWSNYRTLSFCTGGRLLVRCGINWDDGFDGVSKDIELFLESGVDDAAKFLGSFSDDFLEEGEKATSDIKFMRAEGDSGRFFVRGGKDGNFVLAFDLLVVILLANIIIEVQEQEFYGLMVIVDFEVITTIDDGVASRFFPAGEILDDFFIDKLFNGGEGDFIGGRLNFIDTY